MKSHFHPGKLIVAINRNNPYPDTEVCIETILHGVEYEKFRVILPAKDDCGSEMGDVLLIYLTSQKKSTVIYLIEKLSDDPNVAYVEPNFLLKSHLIPNDEFYKYLWGMEVINAPSAWDYVVGSEDVVVGVVDSGIDHNHPDIAENMWTSKDGLPGWNFVDNDANSMDVTGHGTHVAGTIGAVGNNFIGVAGVCWKVKLASLKAGNERFTLAAAIQATDFANANNISILNNSWGFSQYSAILKHAIENYNGLYVASAGNAGANSDIYPEYPAAFDNDNIISVAASNRYNALASFSNYGVSTIDIAAPGTDILSLGVDGGYSTQQGTSMSAPYVTGAAALLKAYKPNLTVMGIKKIILQSVKKHQHLDGLISTGGVLDVGAMFELASSLV